MSVEAIMLSMDPSAMLVSTCRFSLLALSRTVFLVAHDMAISLPSFVTVITSGLSSLLASYLATVRAGKVRLAEVLRIRGG